jgi:hypothetical protein
LIIRVKVVEASGHRPPSSTVMVRVTVAPELISFALN